jgi:hypothetical protein
MPIDGRIVKAAIYPAIGVARIGNSLMNAKLGSFYGPETSNPEFGGPAFYRDPKGALKRQSARFRIYGLNKNNVCVDELKLPHPDLRIRWWVHLSYKKAAWYQFQMALDVPDAVTAPPTLLRNPRVPDRTQLVIDSGKKYIEGVNRDGVGAVPLRGTFLERIEVYLGELRTDEAGRLVVLGGRGKSASANGSQAVFLANNEDWYDDVSDGPVTAEVVWKGRELEVVPAWVVVAPPNYAPAQKSVRTMWDLMRDVAIKNKALTAPAQPSFSQEIQPIFERLSALQWVNAGFAANFGWGGPCDFAEPTMLERLSNGTGGEDQDLRRVIANQFRNFARDPGVRQLWPWLYGDAFNIPPTPSPRQYASLTDTQLNFLQQWANGDFVADYAAKAPPAVPFAKLPYPEQAETLTRAALDFCIADAFAPGWELTWPVRAWTLYMAPFRIQHAAAGSVEADYGPAMDPEALIASNGPLGAQWPGGLTRWMAIPWQTDAAACLSGYEPKYNPHLPAFWPARVPNQVLTFADYKKVKNMRLPTKARLAAFARRARWMRHFANTDFAGQLNGMVKDFGMMGLVAPMPGPGDGKFPAVLQVEGLPKSRAGKEPKDGGEKAHRINVRGVRAAIGGLQPADPGVTDGRPRV